MLAEFEPETFGMVEVLKVVSRFTAFEKRKPGESEETQRAPNIKEVLLNK